MYEESTRIAELNARLGDWRKTRDKALADNLLQARTSRSSDRRVQEVCARLQALTARQLELFRDAMQSDQLLLLWLAVCKRYALLRDFAAEVIRGHFLSLQLVLAREEFDRFLDSKSLWHPNVESLADSTKAKLSSVTYQMLREAGLVSKELLIQPVLLSPEISAAIIADDNELLRIYPIADSDIPGIGR